MLDQLACPLPLTGHATVQLGHGSGGRMMQDLIAQVFGAAFSNPALDRRDDSAVVHVGGTRLAFTTDSFVVDPLFFPGGDIGELAVCGTVNDLAMVGATPLFLSVGVILEEGFPLDDLQRVVASMKRMADAAGVQIVTGDTKVVHKGKGDKLFLNTAGIGRFDHDWDLASRHVRPGDKLLLSGSIAEHGMAILSQREGLAFESPIVSDAAPLNGLVQTMLAAGGDALHALRDATRGGVAAVLTEWAEAAHIGVRVAEARIPVQPAVAGACAMLGLDPLYVANEGKLLAAVAPERAADVLAAMRAHPLGANATLIGDVSADQPGMVRLQTPLGAWRVVDLPPGEALPRIC